MKSNEVCIYTGTSDKGHSERGQTSQQRTINCIYTLELGQPSLVSTKDKRASGVHYPEVFWCPLSRGFHCIHLLYILCTIEW